MKSKTDSFFSISYFFFRSSFSSLTPLLNKSVSSYLCNIETKLVSLLKTSKISFINKFTFRYFFFLRCLACIIYFWLIRCFNYRVFFRDLGRIFFFKKTKSILLFFLFYLMAFIFLFLNLINLDIFLRWFWFIFGKKSKSRGFGFFRLNIYKI